ncbi:uncharacterized protein LOC124943698 [Impatiens glandulifera]|uniref:uncharacterized protein LOC124943698 n=1 Tax=Impatiens glandulifera TaxID=253017 RepID=UPI001FB0E1A0|nr:uncharacterized protein LOC124943698 [Impatiens glandulifera]
MGKKNKNKAKEVKEFGEIDTRKKVMVVTKQKQSSENGDDVIDCVNMNNQLASNHGPIVDNTKDLKYVVVQNYGRLFGASATFTVWKPQVEHNEFSLAQIWITSGNGSNTNTIEVGWIADNYNTTGCYDHDCVGFVQIDFRIQPGQPIFPSTLGGQLTFLTMMVYKDGVNGHWWLDVNGILIGYFPKYIFTSLSEYAERVDFGGEILNKENEGHHTTTQMGNGLYPNETRASVISLTRIYDQYRNPVEARHEILITAAQCYGALIFSNAIFYGGPGYSAICP